jgi:phosphoribosylformylglycinamidine synthase
LSSWNVCSKEWVIRQYDHEVQGASVLKPLQGVRCDGPGDAAVMRPILSSKKGFAVSNGINPMYGTIDPYWMSASVIDEAIRQIIAVGGDLDTIALLDIFCWGNTNKESTLGSLVEASKACYDIAKVYGTPFISGKDSLNNEFKTNKETISIPPTLLISAIGIVENVEKTVSMDIKLSGSRIYCLGKTYNEMGGSHYFKVNSLKGGDVPKVKPKQGKKLMKQLTKAIQKGLVLSCHDCSEGGIAVAVSEMAFAGNIGVDITVCGIPADKSIKNNATLLFSESNTRFIVEIAKENVNEFEKAMKDTSFGLIGESKDGHHFRVEGLNKEIIIDCPLDVLRTSWKKPFSKW